VSNLELSFETDSEGRHSVVFSARQDELIPPRNYDERLSWIKASFSKFLLTVRDLEALRSQRI